MYSSNSTLCSSWAICMGVPTLIHFLFPLLELIFYSFFPSWSQLWSRSRYSRHILWSLRKLVVWFVFVMIYHTYQWPEEIQKKKKERKKRDCMWIKAISRFEIHIFKADGLLQDSLFSFSGYVLFSSMICNLHRTSISTSLKERTAREKQRTESSSRSTISYITRQKEKRQNVWSFRGHVSLRPYANLGQCLVHEICQHS